MVAREFCELIEAHPGIGRKRFLEKTLLTLSRLYTAGVHLPLTYSSANYKERRMTHQQWQALFMSIGKKLGVVQGYWEFFNPRSKDDPVAGSLADDLADSYRDIKPGLLAFEKGSPAVKESVVRQWRAGLILHWGHHATGALYALHNLMADGHFMRP